MKIFTKAEAIATINTERPSEETLDEWLASGRRDYAWVRSYMSPAVVRLTDDIAMRCLGKTLYVWMGQFHILSTKEFTKAEKVRRMEKMKLVSYDEKTASFTVETTERMNGEVIKDEFEISDQMDDGVLRSGSGGDVIYAFLMLKSVVQKARH